MCCRSFSILIIVITTYLFGNVVVASKETSALLVTDKVAMLQRSKERFQHLTIDIPCNVVGNDPLRFKTPKTATELCSERKEMGFPPFLQKTNLQVGSLNITCEDSSQVHPSQYIPETSQFHNRGLGQIPPLAAGIKKCWILENFAIAIDTLGFIWIYSQLCPSWKNDFPIPIHDSLSGVSIIEFEGRFWAHYKHYWLLII